MVERVIRTLKDQCVHRHRFETLQHASRVIAGWISFYNTGRPHLSLGTRTPEAFKLAARPEQESLSGRDGWAVLALVIDCCPENWRDGICRGAADRERQRRQSSKR